MENNFKLVVNGKIFNFNALPADALQDALQIIGENIEDRNTFYNISKRIYDKYDLFVEVLAQKKRFDFVERRIFMSEIIPSPVVE